MNDETLIIDILLDRFERDKSLQEIKEDYEDLELMITRERAANGDTDRQAAFSVSEGSVRMITVFSTHVISSAGIPTRLACSRMASAFVA
jgi:hypothetical protein